MSMTSIGAGRRADVNIGGRSANQTAPATWIASETAMAATPPGRPGDDTVVW
jgi:hypothetical protein